jgi:allantoinase
VLLDRGHRQRGLALERIASLISEQPAKRFRISDRGRIIPGAAADFAIVDISETFVLKREDLLQRHPLSPYLDASFHGMVKQTIRRGETIFADGKACAASAPRLVRPQV